LTITKIYAILICQRIILLIDLNVEEDMSRELLQVWAGVFYLLNKVFFSLAEVSGEKWERRWRLCSWVVYAIGLPGWLIIFASERNWIFAAVEASEAPTMVMGFLIAFRRAGRPPKWLDYLSLLGVIFGLSFSLYDFGGMTEVKQFLEIAGAIGYLVGTYLLAKKKSVGYPWFMLMNSSNAVLMYIQDYPWLTVQQVASLFFVLLAYLIQRRKAGEN